jgi:DNA-binding IclR family transcriptional regulator
MSGPNYSQSLTRGLKILGCFTPERPFRGIAHPQRELVDAFGPRLISTADRISARLGYRREDQL